ncbi:MAG: protein-disulfide reductase DsbD family protein [SAR86 cluster bacterium]|nr:protein-disulfide reductase DsbD family protein [SAR86 cluster bacterium]
MYQELFLTIYKNIIKFFAIFSISLSFQLLEADSKFEASNSSISLLSESYTLLEGDDLLVGIKFKLAEGWHTYWKNPGDAGEGASIEWNLPEGLKASKILWPGPHKIPVEPLMTFGYNDEVVLLTKIFSTQDVVFPLDIKARVGWFTCKDICIPQEGEISLRINEGNKIPTVDSNEINSYFKSVPTNFNQDYRVERLDDKFFLQTEIGDGKHYENVYFFPEDYGLTNYVDEQKYEKNLNSFILEVNASDANLNLQTFAGVIEATDNKETSYFEVSYPLLTEESDSEQSVFLLIIFAFIGGLILNIMPCVFPILSIKILRFMEHSENSSIQTYKFGLYYSLGAIMSFLIIAFILIFLKSSGEAIGWGFQLQYPLVISILFYLFIALGFMFMSNLVFGGQLGQLSSIARVKNESLESFLTGILAVIVASPCTAPFMGSAIGFALLQPGINSIFIFLSLGIGFALPYFILSVKPSLLAFLPKPGAWMETFKQFMAFPMWGSALWLLWVLSGQVDTDTVVLVLIGGLLISLSLWLLEKNTSQIKSIQWVVRLISLILVLFSLWIIPTSYSEIDKETQGDLVYSEAMLQEFRDSKELIFLNFTADWCITCKVNERVALKTNAVNEIIRKKNIKYIEADWTRKDSIIAKKLEEFGRTGVPLYLLYPSEGEPIILPEILTEDTLISYLTEIN